MLVRIQKSITRKRGKEYASYYIPLPPNLVDFLELNEGMLLSFKIEDKSITVSLAKGKDPLSRTIRKRTFKAQGGQQYYLTIPKKIVDKQNLTKSRITLKKSNRKDVFFILEKKVINSD